MTTLNRRELRALLGGGSVGYSYDGSGYGEKAYDGNAHGFIPAGGGYADDEEVVGFIDGDGGEGFEDVVLTKTPTIDLTDAMVNFGMRLELLRQKVDGASVAKRSTQAFNTFDGPWENHRAQWNAWSSSHADSVHQNALAAAELSIFNGKQGIFEQEFAALPGGPNVPQNAPLPSGEAPRTKPGSHASEQPSSPVPAPVSSGGGGLAPNTIMKAGAGIAILGALALAFSGGKGRGRR